MKFCAMVENIYFSLTPVENLKNWESTFKKFFASELESIRTKYNENDHSYYLDEFEYINGIKRYPYGFYYQDKFRIYISSKTGDNYPVYVIVSAQYMHLENVHVIVQTIKEKVIQLFELLNEKFTFQCYKAKLSRIDICNHTKSNIICPDTYIPITEYNSKVVTRIRKVFPVVELIGENEQKVAYFRYGKGDLVVRFYDKLKEVCDMRYKAFFFRRWHEIGLITLKQKLVYKNTYMLNNNFYLDFLFAHFLADQNKLKSRVIKRAYSIYTHKKFTNDEKYDLLMKWKNINKIRLVPKITNVEFQVRSTFLKSIKLVSKETGELIDYTNMYDVFANIENIYKYLTEKSFRVVASESNAKRKRAKTTCPIWKEIQDSKIVNIDKFDVEDFEIYREYQSELDMFDSINKTVSAVARNTYLRNDVNYDNVSDFDFDDMFDNVKDLYHMNENYFNFKHKLKKQIKNYGEKKTPENHDEND